MVSLSPDPLPLTPLPGTLLRRLKTVRRPPIYPKTPGHLPCSSLTHPLPLSSRRPSVSFGGFGLSSNINTAKFRTTWEDPPNLDVNWVESMVKWRNDTENDVVVYDSGKCSWYWLWITGWTDEGGSCWWSYEDSNQWLVMVDTIHDFDNTSFPCPDGLGLGFGAATNYDPNRVGGSLYGSWGTSTTTATGDCAYLLDSRDVLYPTFPISTLQGLP